MLRVLFVCGKARMRSPTAADVVAGWENVHSDFAGLSNDADERISSEQIIWADVICVMEQRQKKRLTSLFNHLLSEKRIVVLSIPDRFDYMDPELLKILEPKLKNLFQ
jgi:predicted protein tyrosine phosphatase